MAGRCETKYPLLMMHGVGFRDFKHVNYWGRIPRALETEGAQIYYGKQDSWATIEHNAGEMRARIDAILAETGCDKVNLIGHSKGGLEARYLASRLGYGDKIASITTIATPHHGSGTIDLLLRLPGWAFRLAAFFVNVWCRVLGDAKPDFYHTCRQLSASFMEGFNKENPDCNGVYYQSYATAMRHPLSDFLVWIPFVVVSRIDGECDGLVSIQSATWTNFGGVWRGRTGRGISHIDSVDGRRRNFSRQTQGDGVSDIRDMYILAVERLVENGC